MFYASSPREIMSLALHAVSASFELFLGRNRLQQSVYDFVSATRGCDATTFLLASDSTETSGPNRRSPTSSAASTSIRPASRRRCP